MVHRVASLLKRWLLGIHQGAEAISHFDYFLDDTTCVTCNGYAVLGGRHIYFGRYDLSETREKYHQLMSEWLCRLHTHVTKEFSDQVVKIFGHRIK